MTMLRLALFKFALAVTASAFAALVIAHLLTYVTARELCPYSQLASSDREILVWAPLIGVAIVIAVVVGVHLSASRRRRKRLLRGLGSNPPQWAGWVLLGLVVYMVIGTTWFIAYYVSNVASAPELRLGHGQKEDPATKARKELEWDLWILYVSSSFWLVVYGTMMLCIGQIIRTEIAERQARVAIARSLGTLAAKQKKENEASPASPSEASDAPAD
jgi:hypothetical protein